MTIGELKRMIEELPEDLEVFVGYSNENPADSNGVENAVLIKDLNPDKEDAEFANGLYLRY